MGNRGWDYWGGSNGEWYYGGGKWSCVAEEHPKDLIEEVPSKPTRHTFDVPDGVKKITVSQEGNRIIVEMVPEKVEPKPGDVMVNDYGSVYIFKKVDGNSVVGKYAHRYFALLAKDGHLITDSICTSGRPATSEEAQPLWDALKKAGKRWNPETMQVEDVPEIDHIREWVEKHLNCRYYSHESLTKVICDYLKYREGEK